MSNEMIRRAWSLIILTIVGAQLALLLWFDVADDRNLPPCHFVAEAATWG